MWMSTSGGYQKLLPELLAFDGGARSARPVTGSEDEPSRRWRTAKLPKADRVAGVLRYPLSATAGEKPLPRKGPESFPSWTSPVRPRSPAFRNGTTRSLSAPRRRRRRGDRIDRQALCGPRGRRVHRADDVAPACRSGARTPPGGSPQRICKYPCRVFWYMRQTHGEGDGSEGLQGALSDSVLGRILVAIALGTACWPLPAEALAVPPQNHGQRAGAAKDVHVRRLPGWARMIRSASRINRSGR